MSRSERASRNAAALRLRRREEEKAPDSKEKVKLIDPLTAALPGGDIIPGMIM